MWDFFNLTLLALADIGFSPFILFFLSFYWRRMIILALITYELWCYIYLLHMVHLYMSSSLRDGVDHDMLFRQVFSFRTKRIVKFCIWRHLYRKERNTVKERIKITWVFSKAVRDVCLQTFWPKYCCMCSWRVICLIGMRNQKTK